jgi:putative Mg2+ transporter-C (MgtC) family protein
MISTEESIIRLLIAIVLGGLIGYEREAQSKSAGLRTHILVCLGSCLCMIISVNIAMEYFFRYGYTNSDPGRIAAQVVSGVGFLGAGTILANQKGRSIHGLTTAASIWVVAAVGLVVGAGYLLTAAAATFSPCLCGSTNICGVIVSIRVISTWSCVILRASSAA